MEKNVNQSKQIRVLHVLTAMNRAGAETMLMNLYRAIDREKVQFDFAVTATTCCDYDDEIRALGGRIIRYPKYRGTNHLQYKKWWNDFFKNNHEYHIVHGHIGSTASIYLRIAKRYGMYTIAHSHSTGELKSVRDLFYKVYSYSTRYIADYFIGCSTDALISRYGKKIARLKDRSTILNNGVDVKKYTFSDYTRRAIREELGIKDETLVVGTVGRFTEAKNTFFIVDILYEIKKKIPDFVFVWAGAGELKDKVEDYIEKKGLSSNVKLLGVREDIPRVLHAMNVFILPSKFEGLPVIGVEVQAAGVPMLCSDKVSKEVNMSKCVTFLPIDSTAPWVSEILNERTYRRIPDASCDVIKAGYDINSTASWLLSFYEQKQQTKTQERNAF